MKKDRVTGLLVGGDAGLLFEHHDVGGLLSFRAVFNREFYPLTFSETFVTIHLNSGKMNEYIFASFLTDKTVPPGGAEPFNGTNQTF